MKEERLDRKHNTSLLKELLYFHGEAILQAKDRGSIDAYIIEEERKCRDEVLRRLTLYKLSKN